MSEFWTSTVSGPSFFLFLLATCLVLLDLGDLLLRLHYRRHLRREDAGIPSHSGLGPSADWAPDQLRAALQPYALVVSVHNPGPELDDFLTSMQPYRSRLWVIDDASTDETWPRLQAAKIHCIRGERNQHKPGAIKRLLTALPRDVVTVVVLDPDVRIRDRRIAGLSDLERVLFDFQQTGMAAMCPRIAIRRGGWLARLQAFEYWLAFDLGRRSLVTQTITSGIAVYRRDALARILDAHTLSIYAEDLKNALLLLEHGERVYYDGRLVFETDGPRDWRGWFSQRVGWSFGFIKVYAEHWRALARRCRGRPASTTYQYLVYMGGFCLLGHPLKVLSVGVLAVSAASAVQHVFGPTGMPDIAATSPAYVLAAYLAYTAYALVALQVGVGPADRRYLLPVVPFYFAYTLAHLAPMTLGYVNWLSIQLGGRRLYHDHYESDPSVAQGPSRGAPQ